MEKPEHISDTVWQKHLDWFNVTGETARRHVLEHASKRSLSGAAGPPPPAPPTAPKPCRDNKIPNPDK